MKHSKVSSYIKRIRNKDKKVYATWYHLYLQGLCGEVPDCNLSHMARQAVRLRITELISGEVA